jgi:hypothetical protein
MIKFSNFIGHNKKKIHSNTLYILPFSTNDIFLDENFTKKKISKKKLCEGFFLKKIEKIFYF